ncbi:sulfur carrier protein ThiS [Candidatus Magnetominusculus dajiuhuensis]|uniref:sulfur carrier protein ThiS n=1 Tax=Candidatus Magnetominusculus dajiuhuensis TaxID=3137712 RepID=UPI003B434328
MKIRLNGNDYITKAASTVSDLLIELDINPLRVAVELNMAIVKKAQYDSAALKDGDNVEVVNFVGGG